MEWVTAALLALCAASLAPAAAAKAATKDASVRDYPFVVSVGYVDSSYYLLQCAGTILDKFHILTSAHCYDNTSAATSYLVRAGSDLWRYHGQASAVQSVHVHDKYNAGDLNYNVAVLRLAKALDMKGKHAKAVVLADAVVDNSQAVDVLGWGFTKVGATANTPQDLRTARMTTISVEDCVKEYKAKGKRVAAATSFCAVGRSCEGESGDPAIDPKTKRQIGITSWGYGCGAAYKNMPHVFVSLARPDIRKFIAAQLKK